MTTTGGAVTAAAWDWATVAIAVAAAIVAVKLSGGC